MANPPLRRGNGVVPCLLIDKQMASLRQTAVLMGFSPCGEAQTMACWAVFGGAGAGVSGLACKASGADAAAPRSEARSASANLLLEHFRTQVCNAG